MKLQMIGCSHHDAGVEFREKISFTPEEAGNALGLFRQQFPTSEIVLLSTCNRVELYTTSDNDSVVDRTSVATFLAQQQGLSVDEVIDQGRQVFLALTQRRPMQWQHIQTIVKVFTERGFLHFFTQVFVGRRDHSDIQLNCFVTANSFHLTLLKYA